MAGYSFYGVPTSEGALGKNKGCEEAPDFLAKLFGVKAENFELGRGVEKQHTQILGHAERVIKKKSFFIGGTHDITFPLFKAFAKAHKNPSLLIFDAHADSDQGTKVPSHEDFVRALVEQKIVAPENVLIVGLRKIYPSEKKFLGESGVRFILEETIHEFPQSAKELVSQFVGLAENLYVSFDVDVLSEKIMHATHYRPKGGLTEPEAKILLEAALPKAEAIDLVEFNPKNMKKKEGKLILKLFGVFLK